MIFKSKDIEYRNYNNDGQFGGNQFWRKGSLEHRLKGPAMITLNGNKIWIYDNQYHRLDGPAIILDNGHYKEWWQYGKRLPNGF
jgi:hypothetical protein